MAKKKTNEEVLEECISTHGNTYCYDKFEYINSTTKVLIGCKIGNHGYFSQSSSHHRNGSGCPKCAHLNRDFFEYRNHKQPLKKLTNETFKKKSILVHGIFYDYSKVDYKNNRTKVLIGCGDITHGFFEQIPQNHLKGSGCIKCAHELLRKNRKKPETILLKELSELYDSKYIFDLTNYKNNNSKIDIECVRHGSFSQYVKHLLGGVVGCRSCIEKTSKGELKIIDYLERNDIIFHREKTFEGLIYVTSLRFDFYLPKYNVCIEYDGEQHFKPIKHFGGDEMFKIIVERDTIKNEYCLINKIPLLRISYRNFKNIDYIIKNFL